MATSLDEKLKQTETQKTLYKIENEILGLSNLVTNKDFDDRFQSAVVSFKMFLEKIDDAELKGLVKQLHDLNNYNYATQDAYVNHLKRICDEYKSKDKVEKFKEGSAKVGKILSQNLTQFLEGNNKSNQA